MDQKAMKNPGPDHPITIAPNPKRVRVMLGGKTIADSEDSLMLKEASYPAVHYIPRKDVDMAALARTESIYKGEKFSDHAPITVEYEFAL